MSWTEVQSIKAKNKKSTKVRSKTASKSIRKRIGMLHADKEWDSSPCNLLSKEPSFPGKSTTPRAPYSTNISRNNSLPTTPKQKKISNGSIEIPQFDPRIPEITTELAGVWGSEYEYISQNMTLSPLLTMGEEHDKKLRSSEFASEVPRGSYSCPGTMERGQNAFYSKRKKTSDVSLPSITPTNNEVEFEVEFEVETNSSRAVSSLDYRRVPRYDLATVYRQIRLYNVELDDPTMNRGKTFPIGVSTYCTTPRQTECRSFYTAHCKLRCWVLVQRKTLLIRAELPDSFPTVEVEAEVSIEDLAASRGVEVEALLGDLELENIARGIMGEAELIVESTDVGHGTHTGPFTEVNRSVTVKYESRAGLVLHLPRNGTKNNSVADAFVKSIQRATEENGVRLGVLWASGEWDGDGDLLAVSVLSAPSTDALSAITITNEGTCNVMQCDACVYFLLFDKMFFILSFTIF
jgi:hypothetical protein